MHKCVMRACHCSIGTNRNCGRGNRPTDETDGAFDAWVAPTSLSYADEGFVTEAGVTHAPKKQIRSTRRRFTPTRRSFAPFLASVYESPEPRLAVFAKNRVTNCRESGLSTRGGSECIRRGIPG